MARAPKILVFDSGLGGLTVYAEIVRLRPDAEYVYAADEAGFPYGALPESALAPRVVDVVGRMIELFSPDIVVVACNTASTLALADLRAAFPGAPFVGTVPAIKPAAAHSRSRMISVLATPGTVARDYTRALIEAYAGDCKVTLVGARGLARLAEDFMQGAGAPDADVLAEIAPAFVEEDGRRTDCIALGCTHYPLLLGEFERLAPWPVEWIDPAPAIARRADDVLTRELGLPPSAARPARPLAVFTGEREPKDALAAALRRRGFGAIRLEPMPLVFA